MKTTFYLVATLIEHYDEPSTLDHYLFANLTDAMKAMRAEIDKGMESFSNCHGEVALDCANIYAWCDDDGNALTVTIEILDVQ